MLLSRILYSQQTCIDMSHLTKAFVNEETTEPLLVMKGTALYRATPVALVFRSGEIFSNIFFLGFSCASGSALYLQQFEACQ